MRCVNHVVHIGERGTDTIFSETLKEM